MPFKSYQIVISKPNLFYFWTSSIYSKDGHTMGMSIEMWGVNCLIYLFIIHFIIEAGLGLQFNIYENRWPQWDEVGSNNQTIKTLSIGWGSEPAPSQTCDYRRFASRINPILYAAVVKQHRTDCIVLWRSYSHHHLIQPCLILYS